MSVFVTGAGGFLGTTLCRALEASGRRLVRPGSLEVDLKREDALGPFATERYEAIYHLAAWTQAGDFCLRHPGEQWLVNQQINTNVLAWWAKHQPQAKLIFMGTSCAYAPG